jgi:hypothetical protein
VRTSGSICMIYLRGRRLLRARLAGYMFLGQPQSAGKNGEWHNRYHYSNHNLFPKKPNIADLHFVAPDRLSSGPQKVNFAAS